MRPVLGEQTSEKYVQIEVEQPAIQGQLWTILILYVAEMDITCGRYGRKCDGRYGL